MPDFEDPEMPPAKEKADDRLVPTAGSLSSTPRTDAAFETWRSAGQTETSTPWGLAATMERLYETERKDYAALLKTLEKVIGERDALLCNCQTKHTTLWGVK
jgi:hypothetical protein